MKSIEKFNVPSSCQRSGAKQASVLERNVVEKSTHSKSRKRRAADDHDTVILKMPKIKKMSARVEALNDENIGGSAEPAGDKQIVNPEYPSESANDNVIVNPDDPSESANDNVIVNPAAPSESAGDNSNENESEMEENLPPRILTPPIVKYEEQYCEPPNFCALSNRNQIYAKDEHGNEKYFYKDGLARYAEHYDNDIRREVPAKDKDGDTIYIKENGLDKYPYNYGDERFIFPLDTNGMPIYPFDSEKKEFVYPSVPNDREYYGLDNDKNEVPLTNKYDEELIQIYAKDSDGHNIYPKTKNRDEYYIRRGNKEIFGRKSEGQPFYAKDRNGDEFYPRYFLEAGKTKLTD